MNEIYTDGHPSFFVIVDISNNAIAAIGALGSNQSSIDNSQMIHNPDGSPMYNTVITNDASLILRKISDASLSDPLDYLTPFYDSLLHL